MRLRSYAGELVRPSHGDRPSDTDEVAPFGDAPAALASGQPWRTGPLAPWQAAATKPGRAAAARVTEAIDHGPGNGSGQGDRQL